MTQPAATTRPAREVLMDEVQAHDVTDDSGEPDTHVKVAWLKQQKQDGEGSLPLLDFDEQQCYTFDRRRTTFRMVKHSCSYPAPPHKVRMWCSSLGANPDLPSAMDLNTFINTFELITDEKHTLEMAHLTGGETIAFEMVQEQASELSTFLLGTQPPQAKGVIDKGNPTSAISQGAQKLADDSYDALRADPALITSGSSSMLSMLHSEQEARIATAKEEQVAADLQRRKLADELIAAEEEEVCVCMFASACTYACSAAFTLMLLSVFTPVAVAQLTDMSWFCLPAGSP